MNNQGPTYQRPQRPHMQDAGVRRVLLQQEILNIQMQQLNMQQYQLQEMIARQQFIMINLLQEMTRLRLELAEVKDRMAPGLGSSPSIWSWNQGPGPDTPNTMQHFLFHTRHNINTENYTNL